MQRALRLAALLPLLAVLLAGCSRRASPDAASDGASTGPGGAREDALEAEFAGCAAVLAGGHDGATDGGHDAGPVCEVGDARVVRIFVPDPRGANVTFEGGAAGEPPREVPGGRLWSVHVDERATAIVARAPRTDGAPAARFTLRVAPARAMPWLREANALRDKGDLDGAEARARAAEAGLDVREQAALAGLLARVALRRGKIEDAVSGFRRAIALGRVAGVVSAVADDATSLAFTLDERAHRFAEARAVLDTLDADVRDYPEGRARAPFYRGELAVETADPRTALRLLDDARLRAERLGMARLSRTVRHMSAQQLVYLGREEEALLSVRAIEAELAAAADAPACERVELALTASYAELRLGLRSEADDARALAANAACADTYMRAMALGHLAESDARDGKRDSARARLAEARAVIAAPRLADILYWLDLEATLTLAEGAPARAVAIYEREAGLAAASHADREAWRAALGKGEALEAARSPAAAARAYEEAEVLLDRHSLSIPLGEGRAGFLAGRDRSARLLVDLLVRLGREADAMAAARRARARVLSGVALSMRVGALDDDARGRWERAIGDYREAREALDAEAAEDWKLARASLATTRAARGARGEELRAALDRALSIALGTGGGGAHEARRFRPPSDGELLLTYHPVRSGWVGLAADVAGVVAFRIGDLARDTAAPSLAERLLAPVRVRLQHGRRVRVLPYGWLGTIDFHALPWEGEPLVATMPVAYGLDLEGAGDAATDAARAALVVSDPTGDLPATRAEASAVEGALTGAGWSVVRLAERDATSARVRDELSRASFFHYAGHGLFAGRDGVGSALPLAAGGALTLGDVLALRHAPAGVVLSGCEAARALDSAGTAGIGLAHAFVLAGAGFVIAPVRTVNDRAASALSASIATDLARAVGARGADGPAILRVAQNRLRAGGDPAWADFRAVVP